MRPEILIGLLIAAGAGCLAFVLSKEYASGNVYPEYSSLRTDRAGAAALYEALAASRASVHRGYTPFESLTVSTSAVVMLGLPPNELTDEFITACEGLARRGDRVLIALDASAWIFGSQPKNRWNVRVRDPRSENMLDRDERAASWFDFAAGPEWAVEKMERGRAVAIGRRFGNGSVALVGSGYPFTNEALRESRDLPLIEWAVGPSATVIFDESHLGSEEQGSVMGLMRQFRLQGLLAALLACALLFIWQSSVPFPPERPATERRDFTLAAASASEGLLNLLTRHIGPREIVKTCVAEWRRDKGRKAPPEKLARIEGIAAENAHPLRQWEEIREALVGRAPRPAADALVGPAASEKL